jgi:two-component system, OmpR family, response regulator MprA
MLCTGSSQIAAVQEVALETLPAISEATMSSSVLVVDDDDAIRTVLERSLGYEGYQVSAVADGAAALRVLRDHAIDCVVLDVRMPEVDGLEVCRRLRQAGDTTPIILLTAYDGISDRVGGLEAGADDYLVKPFAFEELVARIHALLRRSGAERNGDVLRFGDLVLEPYSHEVVRAGRRISLTRREFDLLRTFMVRPREVLSREELLSKVWGYDFAADTNVVDVYVLYLRRKLEAEGGKRLLHTVRGAGYALREA